MRAKTIRATIVIGLILAIAVLVLNRHSKKYDPNGNGVNNADYIPKSVRTEYNDGIGQITVDFDGQRLVGTA